MGFVSLTATTAMFDRLLSRENLRALVLSTGVAVLAAAPLSVRAQGDGNWAVCAEEGQSCLVNGEAMVRFGVAGRYVFKLARGPQPCDIASFGSDPAPRARKRCEISTDWRRDARYRGWRDVAAGGVGDAAGAWRSCAGEGGECVVSGNGQVRFGAQGRYNIRQVNAGRVTCDVATFGDPSPGTRKSCDVLDASQWQLCANEGDTCRLPGNARVRYGANGHYVERSASQSVACNNDVFGDPLPETAKQCEYQLVAATGGAAAAFPSVGLPWDICALEGGQCRFRGAAMVRYGVPGRYVYREAADELVCRNESFGSDPAPGAGKQCDLLRLQR